MTYTAYDLETHQIRTESKPSFRIAVPNNLPKCDDPDAPPYLDLECTYETYRCRSFLNFITGQIFAVWANETWSDEEILLQVFKVNPR